VPKITKNGNYVTYNQNKLPYRCVVTVVVPHVQNVQYIWRKSCNITAVNEWRIFGGNCPQVMFCVEMWKLKKWRGKRCREKIGKEYEKISVTTCTGLPLCCLY